MGNSRKMTLARSHEVTVKRQAITITPEHGTWIFLPQAAPVAFYFCQDRRRYIRIPSLCTARSYRFWVVKSRNPVGSVRSLVLNAHRIRRP